MAEGSLRREGGRPAVLFDPTTRRFTATDTDYINFISDTVSRRGVGKNSVEFETDIVKRLALKLTGGLHRVGAPRKLRKTKRELVKYLEGLGFDANVLGKKDKDGGLDILWLPPLGTVPLRAIVSVQCKNSSFDEQDATQSAGRAQSRLMRHSHIRSHHIQYVVFNDYIDESYLEIARGWIFIPLGLSDLIAMRQPIETTVL